MNLFKRLLVGMIFGLAFLGMRTWTHSDLWAVIICIPIFVAAEELGIVRS